MKLRQEVKWPCVLIGMGLTLFIVWVIIIINCGRRKRRNLFKHGEKTAYVESLDIETPFTDTGGIYANLDSATVAESDFVTSTPWEDMRCTLNSEINPALLYDARHHRSYSFTGRNRLSSRHMEANTHSVFENVGFVDSSDQGYSLSKDYFASYMSLDDPVPKRKFPQPKTDYSLQKPTRSLICTCKQRGRPPLPLPPRNQHQPIDREGAMSVPFKEKTQSLQRTGKQSNAICCMSRYCQQQGTACEACYQQKFSKRQTIHPNVRLSLQRPRPVPRLGTSTLVRNARLSVQNDWDVQNCASTPGFLMCTNHPQTLPGGGCFIPCTGDSVSDLQYYPVEGHPMPDADMDTELCGECFGTSELLRAKLFSSKVSILEPLLMENVKTSPFQDGSIEDGHYETVLETNTDSYCKYPSYMESRHSYLHVVDDSDQGPHLFPNIFECIAGLAPLATTETFHDTMAIPVAPTVKIGDVHRRGILSMKENFNDAHSVWSNYTLGVQSSPARNSTDTGVVSDNISSVTNGLRESPSSMVNKKLITISSTDPVASSFQSNVGKTTYKKTEQSPKNNGQDKSGISCVQSTLNRRVKVFAVPRGRPYSLLLEDD